MNFSLYIAFTNYYAASTGAALSFSIFRLFDTIHFVPDIK